MKFTIPFDPSAVRSQRWRWQLKSGRKIVAASSEGFRTWHGARRNFLLTLTLGAKVTSAMIEATRPSKARR